ncbi:MAG TPA: hypothetical protein PLE05_12545, partial [Bacillota bacterium]|nr:hypothetical protein [Bacillota bacterium]
MEILPKTKAMQYSDRHTEEKAVHAVNLPRKWSELSYSGESRIPQGLDPAAGSWSTYFFRRNEDGLFTTLYGNIV